MIPAGSFAAFGTFSGDKAVCQKGAALFAICLWHFLFIYIRAFIKLLVKCGHEFFMLRGRGFGINIITEPQLLKAFFKFLMVEITDFLR